MMRRLFVFLSGVLLPFLMGATELPVDSGWSMVTNKPFYVNGETIHFAVFCPFDSGQVYVELLNQDGKSRLVQQYQIRLNSFSGNIPIPANEKEGFCTVRFLDWNGNKAQFPVVLFSQLVPVYSDAQFLKTDQKDFSKPILSQDNPLSAIIALQTDRPFYHPGDSVRITLKGSIPSGKKAVLGITSRGIPKLETPPLVQAKPVSSITMPDAQWTIRGELSNPQGDPLTTLYLMLYSVEDGQFFRTTCDKGIFSFDVPAFTGIRTFQVFDIDLKGQLIPVVQSAARIMPQYPGSSNSLTLMHTPDIDFYINRWRKQKQTTAVFLPDSPPPKLGLPFPGFKLNPDKTHKAADYDLQTVEEFLREALAINLKRTSGIPSFLLQNRETGKFFQFPPWFLINGYLSKDYDQIYQLPIRELEKIELFNRTPTIKPQFDRLMMKTGVIAISIKNQRLPQFLKKMTNTFQINGFEPQPGNSVANVVPENPDNPRFTDDLFWRPVTDSAVAYSFKLPDDTGQYQVSLQVFDGSGMVQTVQQFFEVAMGKNN